MQAFAQSDPESTNPLVAVDDFRAARAPYAGVTQDMAERGIQAADAKRLTDQPRMHHPK